MKEFIHADFFDLSAIVQQLQGYNACFFCLGTTAIGVDEETYFKTTNALTLNFASTLSKLNKKYVSIMFQAQALIQAKKGVPIGVE